MKPSIRKHAISKNDWYNGKHRYEHWYRDSTVYFITARCREKYAAFETEAAKAVFWDRFGYHASAFGFVPWVTTLMNNHYHTLGYLRVGENLAPFMQRLHGSVAKLVNDVLPERRRDFWRDKRGKEYFDGCIRDEMQCRRAYRYTLRQTVRNGICADWRDYAHTRVNIDLDRGVKRALELNAFLEGIPYRRYIYMKGTE